MKISKSDLKPIGVHPRQLALLPDIQNGTARFMRDSGQLNTIGDFNRAERHEWLMEEIAEYLEAYESGAESEEIDGLIDIAVIAIGTVFQRFGEEYGRLLIAEVVQSNLNKLDGGARVREDGKIQKPEGWVPPNLAGFIAAFHAANGSAPKK